MKKRTSDIKSIALRSLLFLAIVLMVTYSLFPLYWMIVSSFKAQPEMFAREPTLFPHKFILTNYIKLVEKTNAPRWFLNSTYICVIAVFICIAVSCMGGYSLTRFRFKGRVTISNSILFVYMFPPIMVGIPLFFFMKHLNLLDSHIGLILTYSAQTVPYTLWLLRAFFQTIPLDIEDSAYVDGASRMQTLIRIVLPLALPGIVASSVFSMMVCWNEYVYAFLFLSTEWKKTIPTGLRHFTTSHGVLWQYIFPLSVLAAIPLALFFLAVQRRLMETMAGGVKG
jgi:multiple sugar transport system permease protein